MPRPRKPQKLAERPVRGSALETRERLVETAASIFNDVGYLGTDSNIIAKAAGYSPGTFYRHFEDKRAIFFTAYSRWVNVEWNDLAQKVEETESGATDLELASAVVKFLVAHHRQWRTFRGSLRALAGTDEAARKYVINLRKGQLQLIADLRARAGNVQRSLEEDLLLLLTLERACDALADEEVSGLGAGRDKTIKLLLERVQHHLGQAGRP